MSGDNEQAAERRLREALAAREKASQDFTSEQRTELIGALDSFIKTLSKPNATKLSL